MRYFAALAPFAALALLPTARAEVEKEIPLGIEAVTGMRTDYIYRGFDLAAITMDFQLESEIALRDGLYLNLGGWFATEARNDFDQLAGFLDIRYDLTERFTVGASGSYHDYNNSFFSDGFDLGAFVTYYLGEEWDVTVGGYRDLAAEAWYTNAESGWSHRLSDDSYFGLSAGLSYVDSYYGRSGFNDVYGRASVTYNVNSLLSLTPFVGWSFEIEDGDGDEVFGGIWFEVSF